MHQGLALSPLLFVIVITAISREFMVALPWELLYADDLAVIAETEEELIERLNEWKDNVESKGMRVNMNKTKKIKYGKWKRENTKEARMEYKKSRQNAKRVISSAQEKKQKECANDLNLCNCIVKEGSIPEHKWRTSQGEAEGCKMAMWGLQ